MANGIGRLKEYAGIFGKGMLLQMAPSIAGGIIKTLFREWEIDVAKVTERVEHNTSLWEDLTPEYRDDIKALALAGVGMDFITPEFVINSISKDFPAVASLFLNWPEAAKWLEIQVDDLKAQIKPSGE